MPTQLAGVLRRVTFAGCLLLLQLSSAAAEEATSELRQPSAADELFTRGKQRLAADDYPAACALLAESYRLDPATGSLLALALCHERQGKLASALREYSEVVERARDEKRSDRESAARARVYALQAKTSTLAIGAMQRPEDLTVRVNDVILTPDQFGHPLPVDGGFLLVEAEAAGRQPWSQHVRVADSGDAVTLTVPPLKPELKPASAAQPAQAVAPTRLLPVHETGPRAHETRPRGPSFSPAEKTGMALMGLGAVGATVSLGYTVRALQKSGDSRADCEDDTCSSAGLAVRKQARRAGDIATVSVLAAVVTGGSGLIAFLVGRENKDKRRDVRASGWFAPSGAGASLAGRF
jgi:hypothetical protein